MEIDPETLLWPHEPGVDSEPRAKEVVAGLRASLQKLVEQHPGSSPADLGRHLGADVKIAPLTYPRQGWTWFRPERPLIEVAEWLSAEVRDVVISHELCHLLLGPLPDRHDSLTERVCNWGAGWLLAELSPEGVPS